MAELPEPAQDRERDHLEMHLVTFATPASATSAAVDQRKPRNTRNGPRAKSIQELASTMKRSQTS
ncbi:uncharacterized protein PADG_08545 [Paracoccidioides brasiliensis Pb18]|uniref:Uncharacterized protein n=1 Tax=Paracoccidioides brasiliensis (strain Pb18) TaxID=502780 RepID=C1GMQ1_PARBD|nr:uncharacterized protein PADG_08545 [Paracoccidioides brasiliensis Pb18]EEH44903.2 hypothetical protein PADG_08545 [Paracoccidioides brasiliensis Pb18]ODH45796.1 hypothetical protein GX48_08124 [Paracoccidioides brasiliensis]